MATISDLKKNWARVNLRTEVPKIIYQTREQIIKLNQDQLFKSSEDSLGAKLPAYKSKIYAAEKVFKNPGLPFGAPDLKLTGGFYRGFQVTVDSSYYYVFSTDEKAAKLELKYGAFIFGINKSNTDIYAMDYVFPKIIDYVEGLTGLKFN